MLKKLFFFKKHFSLLGVRGVGIISLFASYKLINIFFGTESFGIFTLLVVYTQIGNMVSGFGLPVLTMKKMSYYPGGERINNVSNNMIGKHTGIVFCNSMIYSLLLLVMFFLPLNIFPQIVELSYIFCIIATIPFMVLSNLNSQILRANDKPIAFQWLTGTVPFLVFSLFLLLGLVVILDTYWLYLFYLLSQVFTWMVSYYLIKKNDVNLFVKINLPEYLKILREAFDYFSTQFITQGFNWATILITAYLINKADTGGINIITKYLSLAALLIMVTNTYQGPNYTHLFHINKIKELNKAIMINTKFIVYMSLPLIIILAIGAPFFLRIFSEDYVHLVLVFRIMLIGSIINLLCGSVGMLMQMTNQQKTFRNIMLQALIIHVLLGTILTYTIGVIGLGLSLTFALIYWNIYSTVILKKEYKIIAHFSL